MIYTVLGTKNRDEIGLTLTHEHFRWINDEDYTNRVYNKIYNEKIINESYSVLLPVTKKLMELGCKTVVEASPPVGGQDIKLLKKLSEETGINIIASTGWDSDFKENNIKPTREFFANRWIEEFKNGLDKIDNITIKPGYIKILLCKPGNFLTYTEKAILEAASDVSLKNGLSVLCHLFELDKFEAAISHIDKMNLKFTKFAWAHASKVDNYDAIKLALHKGFWIGLDMITPDRYDISLRLLKHAFKYNYQDKLLLSQDYDFYKECINNEPENCYSIFTRFIPFCIDNGINNDNLIKIMNDNPYNFYSID